MISLSVPACYSTPLRRATPSLGKRAHLYYLGATGKFVLLGATGKSVQELQVFKQQYCTPQCMDQLGTHRFSHRLADPPVMHNHEPIVNTLTHLFVKVVNSVARKKHY